MVYRIYVEKKETVANEANDMLSEVKTFLGIKGLESIRILNRYDVEDIDRKLFDTCIDKVFSEPQVDIIYEDFAEAGAGDFVFAVEALPGQYDQRADSAAQCIQIISQQERPVVKCAKVYVLEGNLSKADIEAVKDFVINPVETREADQGMPETLKTEYEVPESVEILHGFIGLQDDQLDAFIEELGLAMDTDDLKVCRDYFASEKRAPTITEIKMIDTYWSDHCRHTTFNTVIDDVRFEDEITASAWEEYLATRRKIGRTKPITLMDLGTIGAKALKAAGKLDNLDESDEINACTVKIKAKFNGKEEDWLLLFKNETHNHPTEIEPFGGAATCIGGAIRDPLSGRAYVYTAMRISGAANPLRPLEETPEGKLPQRKIVTAAADGYSSYGNQIGVTTGLVEEIYHDGYVAKHMELGAVVGAAPRENVVRKKPEPGDMIILLGGKTGRDGCGGATGSSKSHDLSSLESCGAEVQKGNAPEERKIQRLFRNGEASRLIKKCNDFGAGGVSVAIGELADGLNINLDAVPKKYEGLDGTELAISESQERMAVVVAAEDAEKFKSMAADENLEATVVATVTEEPRLVMKWRGDTIVDVSREFLDSNGAEKHINVVVPAARHQTRGLELQGEGFTSKYEALAADLNVCSKRGLSEKFDSTVGAGTVLMPFGGKYQLTPAQVMVQKISHPHMTGGTCSIMSWGYNPFISSESPYHGAYLAVVDSVCKLIAAGGGDREMYLSFQEYFEKLGKDSRKWGKPMAALLGALQVQQGLKIASIGGKDSMSGSFEDIDVPPTLVSFAITTADVDDVISNEFKAPGHKIIWVRPAVGKGGLPDLDSLNKIMHKLSMMMKQGQIYAAYTPGPGGVAEAVMKMGFGNMIGFEYDRAFGGEAVESLFEYSYGSFLVEVDRDTEIRTGSSFEALTLGYTVETQCIYVEGCVMSGSAGDNESISLKRLLNIYESRLEEIYPCNIDAVKQDIPDLDYKGETELNSSVIKVAKPKVLIPVFPGINCEYDSAIAVEEAGAEAEVFIIRNMSADDITVSFEDFADKLAQSHMVFIPGGSSGGNEPDGAGKFITAFFRNPIISEGVTDLLDNRGGLMCGMCNGFQALIKLGLVPYGKIMDIDADFPTLTLNEIGRHQSKMVRVRVASNKSPWLANTQAGDIFTMPVSHGEGRLLAEEALVRELAANGQIATQYVDEAGKPSYDIRFNPNGSVYAVEGMTSPDGRVFGKMGHAERIGYGLYKNIPGIFDMKMFKAAVEFFK
jgi:phosphoribosylformylglycinamidine synthase